MLKKIGKKTIAIILLVLTILSSSQGIVNALEISSATIEDLGDCGYHLQFWDTKQGAWSYIITTLVGYRHNGELHYAYCLDANTPRSWRDGKLYSNSR